jgi:DNA polymerase elongation subunit (family B)
MKKLAKTLDEAGFTCLYGFTDSIFILIPEGLTKEDAMMEINLFIKEVSRKYSRDFFYSGFFCIL